ncbi:hypothetical protein T492DRAFT_95790 [Pavlovales sp. CCMP2436]|nr:hypothetical protein T492DRAFT_95790 [Pavlovales sp. CCMP2436]
MFPLFRLLLLLASAAVASSGPVTFRAHALHVRAPLVRANVRASSADPGSGDEAPASTEEWRSFRARLVAQEAKEQAASAESPEGEVPLADGPSDGWIIELPIIEEGSVILASTQQRHGFGLHQQYFHKCAMLVLSHGPEFTRGIILNRPTPFRTDEGWPLWYGGDVQSLTEEREAREITCIHTLDLPAAEKMSLRVTPEISYTSYEGAKELVAQGVAQPSDFWTFCGYAGWGPGQLQSELDRKTGSSWRLVSANGAVLLRELIGQRRGGATADDGGDGGGDGIDTWERLMRGIGQGVSEVDATSGGFADRMLREWIRVNLRPLAPTPALTVAAVAARCAPEAL